MKACTALPRRSAAGMTRRKCRHTYQTQIHRCSSTERRRNSASPIIPGDTAAHPSIHIDQHNKTVATAVGDLPLSPVMDPSYWAVTTRHQVPKAKKSKPQNSVERQFRKNPFALALATPIRYCTASKIRIPEFFLQSFNLIAHPESGKPWWVPRGAASEQPVSPQKMAVNGDESSIDTHEPFNVGELAETDQGGSCNQAEIPGVEKPAATRPKGTKPYGPSAYVLARQDLISAFSTKGSGYENHSKRLFGGSSSRYAKFSGKAVWRADTDSFILDQMRQRIVGDLLYFSRLCVEDNRHYIVKCRGWDDVQYKNQGALLWFGDAVGSDGAPNSKVQPGLFATYDITKDKGNSSANPGTTSMAVHNMPMLLGAEYAAKVKQDASVFADGSLFLLARRPTANLQLRLWGLQGYLADYS